MNTAILRSRILDMAIKGELVPQDPNEGTADDLLKTIATQRGKAITPITDNVPFEIPANWRWVKLGDIAESINYGVSESAKSLGQYKLLRITDIQNNSVNWKTVPHTDFDARKVDNYLLKKGDILFARTGATVGKSFLVNCDVENTIFASYLIRVRLLSVFKKYIIAFFNSTEYWRQISDKSVGIGQPNCNGSSLGNLSLPLPPLSEQHRIVAKVEELLSEVDKIEQAQTDITQAATILRSRVLDMAIKGELTHSNTEEWETVKLGDICKTTSGGTPQSKNPLYYQGGDIPWLQSGELHQKYITNTAKKITQAGYDNSSAKYYPINSVLIALYGATVGEVAISKIALTSNQAVCAIFPSERVYEEYLYYFLKTKKSEYIGLASGGAQPNISQEKVKNTDIPLPPLSEQRRIVAKVEELFAEIDKLIN